MTRSSTAARGAGFDRTLLLVLPAAAFMLLLFVYPFLHGLVLSFNPKEGGWLANYRFFFTTDNEWPTIWTTLRLALPATLINVGLNLSEFFLNNSDLLRPNLRRHRWNGSAFEAPLEAQRPEILLNEYPESASRPTLEGRRQKALEPRQGESQVREAFEESQQQTRGIRTDQVPL